MRTYYFSKPPSSSQSQQSKLRKTKKASDKHVIPHGASYSYVAGLSTDVAKKRNQGIRAKMQRPSDKPKRAPRYIPRRPVKE